MDDSHDRNVYVLGAGFSADAGAPLIRDFLDRSREFLLDPSSALDPTERAQFAEVFDFRRKVAQSREKVILDLDDIEQLFGLVEISERLMGTSRTRTSLQHMIVKTLQLSISPPSVWHRHAIHFEAQPQESVLERMSGLADVFRSESGGRIACDMYDFFASLITGILDAPDLLPGRKDTIVTFNYDLVIERSLERLGAVANYHLPDDLTRRDQGGPGRGMSVDILKLHGSANWAVCARCRGSVVVLESKITENPSMIRNMRCPRCGTETYQPLLIPPSWDKSEFREITRSVWAKALEELQAATRVFIIGYSMPEADAFFKYLLTLALAENQCLFKFVVVDLGGQTLPQKYSALLDPLFYKRRFVLNDNGFVQWLAQQGHREMSRGGLIRSIHGYF